MTMSNMLSKSAPWTLGCDCSCCVPKRERQVQMQSARAREKQAARKDIEEQRLLLTRDDLG